MDKYIFIGMAALVIAFIYGFSNQGDWMTFTDYSILEIFDQTMRIEDAK